MNDQALPTDLRTVADEIAESCAVVADLEARIRDVQEANKPAMNAIKERIKMAVDPMMDTVNVRKEWINRLLGQRNQLTMAAILDQAAGQK